MIKDYKVLKVLEDRVCDSCQRKVLKDSFMLFVDDEFFCARCHNFIFQIKGLKQECKEF